MNHPAFFPPPFHLRTWLIQPDLNRISGPDGPVQIEPRVMAVLLALSARPGELVTRLDLLDQVWGDSVVGEEILTRAVSELRRIFGDSARQPEYIETIRNNGYRLIVPVTPPPTVAVEEPVLPPGPAAELPPPPVPAVPAAKSGSWVRLLIVVVVLVAMAVFGPGLLRRDQPSDAANPDPLVVVPLTAFLGREYHPALSPDGSQVAFAWSGTEGEGTAIHIKQRNSETPLRLSSEPGWAAWPAWSPDGQTVAFVQSVDTVSTICLVPSLGGAVRRIHRVAHLIEGLDWSPDGARLVFSARDTLTGQFRLYLLVLASLNVIPGPGYSLNNAGETQPRFSPDGQQLAWINHERTGRSSVQVAPVAGGQSRAVTSSLDNLQGLAWTPDSRRLVYAAAPSGMFKLWEIGLDGGPARWLPTPGEFAWNPTIARNSGDLVYEQVRVDRDLWRVKISDRDSWQIDTTPFLTSTRWEFEADYHPDGEAIAFVSARSGGPEIWLSDMAGGSLRKLTALGASAVSTVRWSPRGERLACNAVIEGEHRILVIESAGGAPQTATTGLADELFSAWCADGQALLVGAETQKDWQIFRVSLGETAPIQITRDGGLVAQEDPSGRVLYFTRPDRPGLWRRETGGRLTSELVLADLLPRDRFNWRLCGDHLIWVMHAAGSAFLLEHDLVAGESLLLAELPGFQGSGIAVSPAGNEFLYARSGEAAGDLMLIAGWGAVK